MFLLELWNQILYFLNNSYIAKACCTQGDPLHTASHVEWHGQMKALWLSFWTYATGSPITIARGGQSAVTGTVSQATMTNSISRLPCGYLYRSISLDTE